MKKIGILLVLISMLSTAICLGQSITKNESPIPVSNIKLGTITLFSLNYYQSTNTHLLTFRDQRYSHLNEYETVSLGSKEFVLEIRNSMLELIKDPDMDASINIDLGDNERISLNKQKSLGVVTLYGTVYRNNLIKGEFWIDRKKIERLFSF